MHLTRAALLLALTLASPLAGQVPAPPQSWLHEALLDRSPVIVRARFVRVQRLPTDRQPAAVFEVLRTLRGKTKRKEILVGGMGERLQAFPKLDKVLFLDPLRSGFIHRLIDVVDLTRGEEGHAERLLLEYLKLEQLPANATRKAVRLRFSLDALEKPSIFASRVAANELNRLLTEDPSLFRPEHLARIQAARGSLPRETADDHTRLVRRLGKEVGDPFAGTELAFRDHAARQKFREAKLNFERARGTPGRRVQLLDEMAIEFGPRLGPFCRALLGDPEVRIRIRAASWLGEFPWAPGSPALIAGFANCTPEERRERAEALGKLGQRAATAALLPFLRDPVAGSAVDLALARIGGKGAKVALSGLREELERTGADAARLGRLRSYESATFEREELKRRLESARRWR